MTDGNAKTRRAQTKRSDVDLGGGEGQPLHYCRPATFTRGVAQQVGCNCENRGRLLHAGTLRRSYDVFRRPQGAVVDISGVACSKSARGLAKAPSDTISRWKNNANVQSAITRTLRLNVGMRVMWYVRCMNHAGHPRSFTP